MELPGLGMSQEHGRQDHPYFYQPPHGLGSRYRVNTDSSRDIDPSSLHSPQFPTNGGFAPFAGSDGFGAQDIVIDSATGQVGLPRPQQADLSTDPLQRFWNSGTKEGSWHPSGLESVSSWQTPNGHTVGRPPYKGYRDVGPGSNAESQFTGGQRDSGYHTREGTRTHYTESIRERSEENTSLIDGYGNLGLSTEQRPRNHNQLYPTNVDLQESPQTESAPKTCLIKECKSFQIPMTLSDYKKHMQRHDKPFRCNIPTCSRKEGFTTKNDLERHQKSVHKKSPSSTNDRSFKCMGADCMKKSKIWPRLDNFKSHCQRIHSREDLQDLIKRSEAEATEFLRARHQNVNRQQQNALREPMPGYQGAEILVDLSRGPHIQNGRGQVQHQNPQPQLILDNVQGNDNQAQRQQPRLDMPTQSVGMARSPSHHPPAQIQRRISEDSAQSAASSSHHHSINTVRTLRENEALAEHLERKQHLPSNRDIATSLPAEHTIQELSKSLATELTSMNSREQLSPTYLESLISKHLQAGLLSSHQTSTKRSASDAGLTADPSPRSSKRVSCEECGKQLPRQCDLKKHMKRHSRPWGCTNEGCNKSFGSKNDWKRHENSQHYQLETWRCHEASDTSKIKQCAKAFFRREPFQQHLRKEHGIADEAYVRDECKARRIGRNWQSGFWCGFCKAIVRLQKRGLEAWDERFNHIDNDHFKKGERIDEWYPLDKDLPKGMLRKDKSRHRKATDAAGGESDEESDLETEVLEPKVSSLPPPPPPPPPAVLSPPSAPPEVADAGSNAGPAYMQTAPGDRARFSGTVRRVGETKQWFCSDCGHGSMSVDIDTSCTECSHKLCESCPLE